MGKAERPILVFVPENHLTIFVLTQYSPIIRGRPQWSHHMYKAENKMPHLHRIIFRKLEFVYIILCLTIGSYCLITVLAHTHARLKSMFPTYTGQENPQTNG